MRRLCLRAFLFVENRKDCRFLNDDFAYFFKILVDKMHILWYYIVIPHNLELYRQKIKYFEIVRILFRQKCLPTVRAISFAGSDVMW